MSKYRNLLMPDGRNAMYVARLNGLTITSFSWRIKQGWKIEDAATLPLGYRSS